MTFEERKITDFDKQFTDFDLDAESQGHLTIRNNIKQLLSTTLSEYKEELLSKMPMETSALSSFGVGYNQCLDQVNKIIKES